MVVLRKLAVASATGPDSEMLVVLVSAKGEAGKAVNPPLPSPLKTEMVLSPLLATTKSRLPSPLKSATATALGFVPTGKGDPAASVNVPSPLPSNTVALLDVELATTRPGGETTTPLELVTVFPKTPEAMATGPVSFAASTKGEFAWATKFPVS